MMRCTLFSCIFLCLNLVISAQQTREEAINNIFSTNGSSFGNFLDDYEEVTPPPLKGIGALTKCGEGDLKDRFVCVPYFNCNAQTKTVQANPDVDGTNKIDVRMPTDETPKCDHYLELCCGVNDNLQTGVTPKPVTPPPRPVTPPTPRPVTPSERPVTPSERPVTVPNPVTPPIPSTRATCGARNAQGLDFNLVGGTNEANFGEFPWMVAILRKNPGNEKLCVCGGSLIGPSVVLTGAHCVHNIEVGEIKIRAGEWDTQTENERIPYQERNVVQKVIHEHFIRGNLYNDVALLILDKPFTKTDSIGTVCLPEQDQKVNSRECFATGWGKDTFGQEGRYAVILKKLQLPLVSNSQCQTALRKTRLGANFVLHRSFICAGGEPNLDTCTGDGGSPLVCPDPKNPQRYIQAGIVAWGIGCGENQVPGVYVDVAGFRNWIDLKLQELGISTNSYIL